MAAPPVWRLRDVRSPLAIDATFPAFPMGEGWIVEVRW